MKQIKAASQEEVFQNLPIPAALRVMIVPAVTSQLIVLIYNMADTFYVGQTNNPYMVASTSLILPVFNITLCLAGLAGIVTDTIGYLFRPNGPYFPFFAINEFLLGFIYGCWFYKKPVTLLRTFLACLTVVLVINLCLSPIWLNMMYGNVAVISGIRLIKNMIKLPVDTLLLYTILKTLEKRRASFSRL